MAVEATFYKFPRTPHLEGSTVVDDDEVVTFKSLSKLLQNIDGAAIIIQEKVDGANVSVHFEQEWVPVLQKRGNLIQAGERLQQYEMFRNWVYEHLEDLWTVLGTSYVLYGEWLWCQHAVSYDQLPDFFMAFDILEKETETFLPYDKMVEIIEPAGLSIVPVVWRGTPAELKKNLVTSLVGVESAFGAVTAEGVYVRAEDENKVIDRWKMRTPGFTAGRADFITNVITNSLADE